MHKIAIASFNVLASAHVPKGRYTETALRILRSPVRTTQLAGFIEGIDTDVIGLQEVDQDLLDLLIATDNWQVFCSPRQPGKVDSCALLVRHTILVEESGGAPYSDKSGRSWHYIVVGDTAILNTHIDWAPESDQNHRGALQMKELLSSVPRDRAVILGDCNGRPSGKVRIILAEGGFKNVWGNTPTALIRHDAGIKELAAIDLIAVRNTAGEPLGEIMDVNDVPNEHCPSDHVPIQATIG